MSKVYHCDVQSQDETDLQQWEHETAEDRQRFVDSPEFTRYCDEGQFLLALSEGFDPWAGVDLETWFARREPVAA